MATLRALEIKLKVCAIEYVKWKKDRIMWDVDWVDVFLPDSSPVEMIVRGAVLYILFVIFFRVMPRRTGGELETMDLVFLLLVTEAASHSLGEFTSIFDGIVMILTMMTLNYLVNFLTHRNAWFERLLTRPPVVVIRDGKMLLREMRREFLTQAELMEHLRSEGISSPDEVKTAYVENDGKLSVQKRR